MRIATTMEITTSAPSNPILPSLLRPCPSQPAPACSSPAAPAADHRARRRGLWTGQGEEEKERTSASVKQCSGGLECSGLPPPPISSSRLHRRPSQSNPSALLPLAAQAPPPSSVTPYTHPASSSHPAISIVKLNHHTHLLLRPLRHPRNVSPNHMDAAIDDMTTITERQVWSETAAFTLILRNKLRADR